MAKKRFSICHMEFLQCGTITTLISSGDCTWQSIHQVAAPCNVIRGSGMTCYCIRPNVRHIGILHLVSISTHHRVDMSFCTSYAKFYPNQTTFGRKKWRHVDFQDGGSLPCCIIGIQWVLWKLSLVKLTKLPIGRSLIDTIALNCLVFWENRVSCILATNRQTNRQTERTSRWTAPMN